MKEIIKTAAAPAAIGAYSQATRAGDWVFLSGQIPLDPASGEIVEGGFSAQAEQVLKNLEALAQAAGGTMADCVKLNAYLVDLGNFAAFNAAMEKLTPQPFPARAAVQVSALPKGAMVEAEAILHLPAKKQA